MSLLEKLKSLFVTESHKVADFLKPFAQKLEADEKGVLIDAAIKAVTIAELTPGDGTVKLAAAVATVTADLGHAGLTYAKADINAAIELAVQKLKASQAGS